MVALSTLPALWFEAEPLRVAETLAAALFSTMDAELVYVELQGVDARPVSVAQTGRYRTDRGLAAVLGPQLLAWAREHDPDELLTLENPLGGEALEIAIQPIGLDGRLGAVAAGFERGRGPSALQRTMLGIGATQAATAMQNATLLRSLRASIAERERAEEALREADRRKDEFIATLSHELRNPLAALRSAMQLQQLREPGIASRPEHEIMQRQLIQLVRLVDDLLEIARIRQGTLELRREPVDLTRAMRAALETAAPLIAEAGHDIRVSFAPEPLVIHGDYVRLCQILANLLNNAARYTPRGGAIELAVRREGASALVSVRDNGIGMTPELIARLFIMFSRGSPAGGGLGVGLALAQRLAEMHGGTLAAQSAGPGRGSEFTLALPVAEAAAPSSRASEPAPAALPRERILVVDDNRDAASSLAALLEMLGAEVRQAHDGPGAIRAFDAYRPGVLLLDIGMPGMDGYEVAREIRSRAGGDEALIVALTGWGQEDDRRRAREAGIDHHLTKPADLDALRSLLGRHADRQASP